MCTINRAGDMKIENKGKYMVLTLISPKREMIFFCDFAYFFVLKLMFMSKVAELMKNFWMYQFK